MSAETDARLLRQEHSSSCAPDAAVQDMDRAPPPISTGIVCLCVIAGQHQRSADPLQLARALGLDPGASISENQLILAAKELGLKAKIAQSNWTRLGNIGLPAIAQLKSGEYVVLLRLDGGEQVLIGDPRTARPQRLPRENFEEI